MPARFARSLTGHARSEQANRRLGLVLAFVAGALNAGGFLAVGGMGAPRLISIRGSPRKVNSLR